MEKVKLYRRRFIPDETVYLKDDVIEYMDDRIIITRWNVLRPKVNFVGGRSCYFMDEGYKVSRFFDADGNCVCTYCDIISTVHNSADEYIFLDLLIDVVIYTDGTVRVLDLGEVAEALEKNLITVDMAKEALAITDKLLDIVYSGGLEKMCEIFIDHSMRGIS